MFAKLQRVPLKWRFLVGSQVIFTGFLVKKRADIVEANKLKGEQMLKVMGGGGRG